ncbi:MAG: hypothetical protein Q7S40_10310 [Opitutaceae bacterium]|nr:hypothetical protein [Opitutaceae bacterium]
MSHARSRRASCLSCALPKRRAILLKRWLRYLAEPLTVDTGKAHLNFCSERFEAVVVLANPYTTSGIVDTKTETNLIDSKEILFESEHFLNVPPQDAYRRLIIRDDGKPSAIEPHFAAMRFA